MSVLKRSWSNSNYLLTKDSQKFKIGVEITLKLPENVWLAKLIHKKIIFIV